MLIDGMGFVHVGVRDLQSSVDFYTEVCGLAVSERREDTAFLTGGCEHHWLRLEERPEPGLIRLGYRASGPSALDEIEHRLGAEGVGTRRSEDIAGDRVSNALRFRDPDGIEVEVFEEMVQLPLAPPVPRSGRMGLLHAVVFVEDVDRSRRFYELLDFRRSDQIEKLIVFMRCGNGYHHSIAMARGARAGALDHFAIILDDIDDLMYFRNKALDHGVAADASDSLVRHAASGSISTYIPDRINDHGVEFCTGHQVIEDEAYRGRLLLASPTTANLWARPPAAVKEPNRASGADAEPRSAHAIVSAAN